MDPVDGVHARLAVETDCPLAALSEWDLTIGGGRVVFRRSGTWRQESTPTGTNLQDVVDALDRDVAVGAGGIVLEK